MRIDTIPTDQEVRSNGLWRDATNTLHMLGQGGTGRAGGPPLYLRYDGAFHSMALSAPMSHAEDGAITLSDDGTVWATWFEPETPSPAYAVHVWRSDTGTDEIAAHLTGGLRAGSLSIIARPTASGPQPIVMLPDNPTAQLVAFARDPSGSWSRSDLISAMGPIACAVRPCTVDAQSATLVRFGTDVRLLFGANFRDAGALHTLVMMMPSTGPTDSADLISDRAGHVTSGIRAVVDACGTIHVAYEYDGSAGFARYLRLGAP